MTKFFAVLRSIALNLFHLRVTSGSRRIVFVLDNIVIKVPKFYAHLGLLMGLLENLHERYWWCADGAIHPMEKSHYPLAPIIYADRFGLCVVMRRAQLIDELEFERRVDEVALLHAWSTNLGSLYNELRPENVGDIDGKLVFIDYGFFGVTSTYLGSTAYKRISYDADGNKIETRTLAGKLFDLRHRVRTKLRQLFARKL